MERTKTTLMLVMAVTLFAACLVESGRDQVPRNGWWDGHGTVVPHDTFPSDCSLCHEGDDWQTLREDFTYDHLAETGEPLDGAHRNAACLRCHNDRGPVAAFARQGCAGCHEDIHRGQLGGDCAVCHGEDSWMPHDQIAQHNRTRFPLIGAHVGVGCWRCHEGARVGNFTRVDIECVTCHASDLASATDPDHTALGWVDRCDRCHSPTSWSRGGFDHALFPLTGGHNGLDCRQCHVGGVFTGLDRACVSCHLDDYQNTTDPDHMAAGFSTNCEMCHDTSGWEGARFSHRFPITGPHNMACNQCHLNPGNFMQFSCTHCHEHRQREADDEHDDVPGYVWESNACYSCHPNGR